MRTLRGFLAVSLSFLLCGLTPPLQAGGKPLGLLTLAYGARLNTAEAFAGLSVFPGEEMATEADGKAMVRIGGSVATLAGDSSMTLESQTATARTWIWRPARFSFPQRRKIRSRSMRRTRYCDLMAFRMSKHACWSMRRKCCR